MKKMKISVCAVLAIMTLISCKEIPKQETETTIESNKIGNKVEGTYIGNIPGANSLINIELTLKADSTCIENVVYVDKSDEVFTDEGTYTFENDTLTTVMNDKTSKYIVGDDYIQALDIDGKAITGSFAENYKFKKQ